MRQAAVACRTLPVSMAAPTAARGASDVLSPRCDGSKNGASCGLLVVCSCHRGRPRHLDATGRARSELRSRAMDVVLQTFSSIRCNRRRSSDGGCAGRPERTDELRTRCPRPRCTVRTRKLEDRRRGTAHQCLALPVLACGGPDQRREERGGGRYPLIPIPPQI